MALSHQHLLSMLQQSCNGVCWFSQCWPCTLTMSLMWQIILMALAQKGYLQHITAWAALFTRHHGGYEVFSQSCLIHKLEPCRL